MARTEPSFFVEDVDVAAVVLKETARERGRGRGRRGGREISTTEGATMQV